MQKRVLVFIPTFPVLSETFIEREVDGLVRSRKLDVIVVSLSKQSEFRSKRAKKVTVYNRLSLLTALWGLGYFLSKPKKVLLALRVVGFNRLYLLIKSLGYAKIFSNYKPDIIYAQFFSEPSSIALVASIILGVPLAVSAHARDVFEYPDLLKEKIAHAKFITFCNKAALNRAKTLDGGTAQNLKLVYHGIDPATLRSKEHIVVKKPSENFIFSIGRLVEKKGTIYLIEAAEILRRRGVKHTIYVAGGGPLFDELNGLIGSKNLEDNIVLLGDTPFSEVIQYLNLSDVYAQPSVDATGGDSDGVPNGLIEAALLRVPIITTNAGSITDFLGEEEALIVSQGNSKELADSIESLLKDEGLKSTLSGRAFSKASEMFNFDTSIGKVEDLLMG